MDGISDDNLNRPPTYYQLITRSDPSQSSLGPLVKNADFTSGNMTPQSRSTISPSPHSLNREPYIDVQYRYSRNFDSSLCDFDPGSIEDDGDDGLEYRQRHRSSGLSHSHADQNFSQSNAAANNTRGSLLKPLEGVFGRKSCPTNLQSQYDPFKDTNNGTKSTGSMQKTEDSSESKKSEWLSKQSSARSRLRLLIIIIVALLVLGAIAGGIISGVIKKKSPVNSSEESASLDVQNNGDLNKNSAEIKKLLNNPKLHKVFPALDYTPAKSQYPDCLTDPPSQNNLTRDMAILSQLSNTVRLYGTDCNQTEMIIHSINQLDLKGHVKIWMGVWLNRNETTNTRQIAQVYRILEDHGQEPFAGIIVGNEVLFRQDMTVMELEAILTGIRSNLTTMGISLPVASSDLGDNWTEQLASKTDILMANIHPFFAGIPADAAASWTWNFWQQHNVVLQPDTSKNMISETGWPSSGGINCGGPTTCATGSVASVDAMNTFMNDWVCQALANGTNYFWFEAFDEPWKIRFNEARREWEDKWGLIDVDRNLKPGVIIPDCGGKTVG